VFLFLSRYNVADKILLLTSITPKYCSILGPDTNNMNRNQSKHEAIHNMLCLKNANWENAFKLHRSWQPCRTWSRFSSSTEYFCVLLMWHSLTSYKYGLPLLYFQVSSLQPKKRASHTFSLYNLYILFKFFILGTDNGCLECPGC